MKSKKTEDRKELLRRRAGLEAREWDFLGSMTGGIGTFGHKLAVRRRITRLSVAYVAVTAVLCSAVWRLTPPPNGIAVDVGSRTCRIELISSVDRLFLA